MSTAGRFWGLVLLCWICVFVLGSLAGCGSDYASPFDKPDVGADPVACEPSGCAK